MKPAASTEDIVVAYRETGSVWKAGKKLNVSGQSVWERLKSIGHPMRGSKWTEEETSRLREMIGNYSITQMSHELGRPYGGIACRISELGLVGRNYVRDKKLPRGAGFDKEATEKRTREMDKFTGSVRQYARSKGLSLDNLIKAFQRHTPDWWNAYVRTHSDLPSEKCAYCEAAFYPMTKKQKTCSRKCQAHHRSDKAYFGGNRRSAIGMIEGVCQLCFQPRGTLSAHHLIGKENDPSDKLLIALCNGCHQSIGKLAACKFVDTEDGWESLINLVMLRRWGADKSIAGVFTTVDIEKMTPEEVEEADEYDRQAEPARVEVEVIEL